MNKLSFKTKILLMLATALAALLLMAGLSLLQERRLIVQARQDTLATAVQAAHSIVMAYKERADSGALPLAEAQKAAKEAVRLARYGGADGKGEYFYIWTLASQGVMHPIKPEWEGQDMSGKLKDGEGQDLLAQITSALQRSSDGRAFISAQFQRPGQQALVPKLQYAVRVDGWNWFVGSGLYMDDVDAAVRQALLADLAIVLVVTLLVGAVGWVVFRSVVGQIGGEPAQALAVMAEVAQGNLDAPIPTAAPDSLLGGLAHMVESLRRLVTQVRSASDSIATAAHQIAQGNTDLAQRVRHTSESAHTANQLAGSAAEVAARGGQVVAQVVDTMQDIHASSSKISDIIGVIDSIAFQTNILALNAAVEAARAGEQGRGFAVVAAEVRNLAQRSAQAAREIKELIQTSVGKVESGSQLVGHAGSTMDDIVASVQRVSDIIGEIRSATAEQSQGIASVSQTMGQLDQMTQQNSALVEESTAAADSLREQAVRLTEVVAQFRVQGSAEFSRTLHRPATRPPAARTPAPALKKAPLPPVAKKPATPALPASAPRPAPANSDDWESF
jgi:methyl-accepting chemotaxis protein